MFCSWSEDVHVVLILSLIFSSPEPEAQQPKQIKFTNLVQFVPTFFWLRFSFLCYFFYSLVLVK